MTERETVEAHVSDGAKWFYCAKQAIDVLHGIRAPRSVYAAEGLRAHKRLTFQEVIGRPQTAEEQEMLAKLWEFRVPSKTRSWGKYWERQLDNFNWMGDTDFLSIENDLVRIHDVKTSKDRAKKWKPEYCGSDIFQVQEYGWLLTPYVERIGRKLDYKHQIHYYFTWMGIAGEDITQPVTCCPTCKTPTGPLDVIFSEKKVESMLRIIQAAYYDPSKKIYPKMMKKCVGCPTVHKKDCPKGNKTLGRT